MTLLRTFVTVVSPLGEYHDLKVKLVYRNMRCLILGFLWRGLKEIYASPAAKKSKLSLDLACGAPDSVALGVRKRTHPPHPSLRLSVPEPQYHAICIRKNSSKFF